MMIHGLFDQHRERGKISSDKRANACCNRIFYAVMNATVMIMPAMKKVQPSGINNVEARAYTRRKEGVQDCEGNGPAKLSISQRSKREV